MQLPAHTGIPGEDDREQTLSWNRFIPVGLFRSPEEAPGWLLTNGLMVGMFDTQENWHRGAALGVANYGQMTAGGWMYIGPQGIVARDLQAPS